MNFDQLSLMFQLQVRHALCFSSTFYDLLCYAVDGRQIWQKCCYEEVCDVHERKETALQLVVEIVAREMNR